MIEPGEMRLYHVTKKYYPEAERTRRCIRSQNIPQYIVNDESLDIFFAKDVLGGVHHIVFENVHVQKNLERNVYIHDVRQCSISP